MPRRGRAGSVSESVIRAQQEASQRLDQEILMQSGRSGDEQSRGPQAGTQERRSWPETFQRKGKSGVRRLRSSWTTLQVSRFW